MAYFYAENEDTDGEGVPDWFEWQFYGTLTNAAASDTDGDGYTLQDEFWRDTLYVSGQLGTRPIDLLLSDMVMPGGLMGGEWATRLRAANQQRGHTPRAPHFNCASNSITVATIFGDAPVSR